MPQRAANARASWRRNQDSGCPATPVESSSPHSSELPVRGVAQIRYESVSPGSGAGTGGMARLKHASEPRGNGITRPGLLPLVSLVLPCPWRRGGQEVRAVSRIDQEPSEGFERDVVARRIRG